MKLIKPWSGLNDGWLTEREIADLANKISEKLMKIVRKQLADGNPKTNTTIISCSLDDDPSVKVEHL